MLPDANPVTERIEWHEGMLLAPQHFQQLSSRIDTLVAWQTLAAAPFSWGVRSCRFDDGLLSAGWARVLALDAIFPDGTAVRHDAADEPHAALQIALEPFAERLAQAPLDVWLTLPVAGTAPKSDHSRFRSVAGLPVEDAVSDAVPADIPRQRPRLGMAVGPVPSGAYVCLRLGRLVKDNKVVKLDATLPPLLEIGRADALWRAASALCRQLRGKAAFLAQQMAVPSSRLEDRVAHLELKDRLHSLLAGLPLCEAVLGTPRLHPLPLYWALTGLLGSLTLLKPGGLPGVPPDYDHAEPSRIFTPLLDALNTAVAEVSQDYREHRFEFRNGAFEIELKPGWTQAPRLVIGLRGQPDKDLAAWMASAIIGTHSVYPSLRERRVLGAPRQPIDQADELGLRPGSGFLLQGVQTSPGLTASGERLIVSNANESATAQRPQEMVLFTRD